MYGTSSISPRQAQYQNARPVVRLLVEPDPRKPGWFVARLEGGAEILVRSRQPLVDGARALIERGFDPDMMLTMRMHDRAYDSFAPAAPIGELAKVTYAESDRDGLRKVRWMPRQLHEEGQKAGSAAVLSVGAPARGRNRSPAAPVMTTPNDSRRQLDEVAA